MTGGVCNPRRCILPACFVCTTMQDDTLSQLQDMASWKTSRLMSFDAASSHIRCHFNELLVGLMREVRQLQGLGYRMKPELSAEVDTAAKFYRCAGALRAGCLIGLMQSPWTWRQLACCCFAGRTNPNVQARAMARLPPWVGENPKHTGMPLVAAGTAWCCSSVRTSTTTSQQR